MRMRKMAKVEWTAKDVKEMQPTWSLKECDKWLVDNEKHIEEAMVECGWNVIHILTEVENDTVSEFREISEGSKGKGRDDTATGGR